MSMASVMAWFYTTVKGVLEYKGLNVVLQHLWSRSGFFKSTSAAVNLTQIKVHTVKENLKT